MRGVSRWASHVAPLLAVFVVLAAANAWAEEPPTGPPTEPPGARMSPPGGLTTQARMQPPGGLTTQARMNPPGGTPEPSLIETLLIWLQSRLSVPNG